MSVSTRPDKVKKLIKVVNTKCFTVLCRINKSNKMDLRFSDDVNTKLSNVLCVLVLCKLMPPWFNTKYIRYCQITSPLLSYDLSMPFPRWWIIVQQIMYPHVQKRRRNFTRDWAKMCVDGCPDKGYFSHCGFFLSEH